MFVCAVYMQSRLGNGLIGLMTTVSISIAIYGLLLFATKNEVVEMGLNKILKRK